MMHQPGMPYNIHNLEKRQSSFPTPSQNAPIADDQPPTPSLPLVYDHTITGTLKPFNGPGDHEANVDDGARLPLAQAFYLCSRCILVQNDLKTGRATGNHVPQ